MASVPHFDLPFRFGSGGHAIEVEQDSMEDVTNCVRAVLLTRVGQRVEAPDFGIPDPVFERQPIDLGQMTDAIHAQEPRAIVLFEQHPDKFENLAADVLAQVGINGEGVSDV